MTHNLEKTWSLTKDIFVSKIWYYLKFQAFLTLSWKADTQCLLQPSLQLTNTRDKDQEECLWIVCFLPSSQEPENGPGAPWFTGEGDPSSSQLLSSPRPVTDRGRGMWDTCHSSAGVRGATPGGTVIIWANSQPDTVLVSRKQN